MASAARSAVAFTSCTVHAAQRAGWRCTVCQRTLCPDCTAERRVPNSGTTIPVCVHCGGLATQLTRQRKVKDFLGALPSFVKSFFTMDGLASLVALGLFCYLGRGALALVPVTLLNIWMALVVYTVVYGIVIVYVFSVIQSAAQGSERLPDPADFTDPLSLIAPVFRFVLALSYLWLPTVLYVSFVVTWQSVYWDGPMQLFRDPVLLALVVGGVVYFPVAVVVAAISDSVLAVLDLRIGLRIIARLPLQYAGAVLTCFVFLVVGWIYGLWASIAVALIPVPFIPALTAQITSVVFVLIPAWVLGRFIYQNHEHFGLMLAGAGEEPEWPDAVPRGQLATDGSKSHGPVQPAHVPGWSPEQAGLPRAAETMAQTPYDARQINVPHRSVEPIEVEGWSDQEAEILRAPPARRPLAQDLALPGADLTSSMSDSATSLELEFEDEPTEGAALDGPPMLDPAALTAAPRNIDAVPSVIQGAAKYDLGPSTPPVMGSPVMGSPVMGSPVMGSPLDPAAPPAQGVVVPLAGMAPGAHAYLRGGRPATPAPPGAAGQGPADPTFGLEPPSLAPPAAAGAPSSPAPPAGTGPYPPASDIAAGHGRRTAAAGVEPSADPLRDLEQALINAPGLVALSAFVRCRDGKVPIALAPQLELRLAGVLERAREFESAVAACRRAADQDLTGPCAPRAIFMAAQLYEQRLNDPQRAGALYRYLAETFPSDQLAGRARDGAQRVG